MLMYYTNMKGGANLGPGARASPLVLKVLGPAPIDKDCGRPNSLPCSTALARVRATKSVIKI